MAIVVTPFRKGGDKKNGVNMMLFGYIYRTCVFLLFHISPSRRNRAIFPQIPERASLFMKIQKSRPEMFRDSARNARARRIIPPKRSASFEKIQSPLKVPTYVMLRRWIE